MYITGALQIYCQIIFEKGNFYFYDLSYIYILIKMYLKQLTLVGDNNVFF